MNLMKLSDNNGKGSKPNKNLPYFEQITQYFIK